MERCASSLIFAEIHYKPVPARSPDGPQADNSALNARIEQIQPSL